MATGRVGVMGQKSRRVKQTLRRQPPTANRPSPTNVISINPATIEPDAFNLRLDFDQPVLLNGVPQYTTDVVGASPVSATMLTATRIEIEFDAYISTATTITIPYEDKAVRNNSGGFVTPTVLTVS